MKRLLLARKLNRLAVQVARVRRSVEAHQQDVLLSCDEWALRRTIGNLIWSAEYLGVIAKHLQGQKLDDGHGYWCDSDFKFEDGTDPDQQTGIRARMLRPGETIEDRNRAEFEAAVVEKSHKPKRRAKSRARSGRKKKPRK